MLEIKYVTSLQNGFKLDPKVKQNWMDALNSGEYVQTTKRLKRIVAQTHEEKYCCMGVLCDVVYSKEKWKNDPDYCGDIIGHLKLDKSTYSAFPPKDLLPDDIACYLSDLNDMQGKTFAEIAKWIGENL